MGWETNDTNVPSGRKKDLLSFPSLRPNPSLSRKPVSEAAAGAAAHAPSSGHTRRLSWTPAGGLAGVGLGVHTGPHQTHSPSWVMDVDLVLNWGQPGRVRNLRRSSSISDMKLLSWGLAFWLKSLWGVGRMRPAGKEGPRKPSTPSTSGAPEPGSVCQPRRLSPPRKLAAHEGRGSPALEVAVS